MVKQNASCCSCRLGTDYAIYSLQPKLHCSGIMMQIGVTKKNFRQINLIVQTQRLANQFLRQHQQWSSRVVSAESAAWAVVVRHQRRRADNTSRDAERSHATHSRTSTIDNCQLLHTPQLLTTSSCCFTSKGQTPLHGHQLQTPAMDTTKGQATTSP